jgi:hypothetical protein
VEGEQGVARGEGADVEGMSRVQDLFAANEVFLDKVHRECTAEAMDKLDSKREALVRIIADEVLPLLAAFNEAAVDAAASGARKKAARRAVLSYDSVNNAVWIRGATLDALQAFSDLARKGEDDAEKGGVKLLHPRDRNGRLVGDCVSTRAAEAALSEYREACDETAAAVRAVLRSVLHVHMLQGPLRLLVGSRWVTCFDGMSWHAGVRELSARISERLADVINAITFCIVAKALTQHLAEAHRKQWTLPVLCSRQPAEVEDQGALQHLAIEGMMPYWMDPSAGSHDSADSGGDCRNKVVANDIDIDKMVVLTGPNTAGEVTCCAVARLQDTARDVSGAHLAAHAPS